MSRNLHLLVLAVVLAQIDCTNTKKSTDSVCDKWAANDKAALDKAVDRFVRSLDPKRPMNENARSVAEWLEKQPCIKRVGIPAQAIATEPPGLDLVVEHRDGNKRSFSILFYETKIRLSYSY